MKAILPAAGYATRMYPLTKDQPKSLLPVKGKPLIEYILAKIFAQDVDEAIVVTNDKFYDVFHTWSEKTNVPTIVLNDGTTSNENRLGTIGDINLAIKKQNIQEEVLLANADNVFSFDLSSLTKLAAEKNAPVLAALDVQDIEIAKQKGTITLDDKRVVNYHEKDPAPKTTLCAIGMFVFPKHSLHFFQDYLDEGHPADRLGDFLTWLYQKTPVFAHTFTKNDGYYFDVGSLETYNAIKDGLPEEHP